LNLVEKFPKMKIILRQSPNIPVEKYINSNLPYFKTLKEIEKYILNYAK